MSIPRVRRALPMALLVAALAVAGAGAFQAHRAQTTHRATAESLLRDYGAFTAYTFGTLAAELVEGGVRAPLFPVKSTILLGSSPHACLRQVLAQARESDCGCGGSLGGEFAFFARLGDGASRPLYEGEAPSDVEGEALVRAVAAHARTAYQESRGFAVIEAPDGRGGTRLLAYARVRQEADTAVYGFDLSRARVAERLERAFTDKRLLPESLTRGRPHAELVAVSLALPSGGALYASAPEAELELAAEEEWPAVLGGGVVRAAVLPEAADLLIIGGLPRSQVPWLLLIFALSAALAGVAVTYLRREARLARERGDFVASVSHELRTPLAQVRLFTETLRLGRTENEGQRAWALATIDRETLRLTRLVENILHFSRAERGVTRLDPEPLGLAEEAAAVVESFRPLLRTGQAEIVVDIPARLQVEADRDALRQVLLNLLDNAAKYGPSGQTIRVSAAAHGGYARLTVEDEGPGVPPRERQLIWQSFRRGEGALGSVTVGSGIGLSVVRSLVTGFGGRCWVEDAAAGGARFVVELPALVTVRAERVAVPASAGSAGADGRTVVAAGAEGGRQQPRGSAGAA